MTKTNLGGAKSCLVASSSVPTYVLPLHVTFTTRMPIKQKEQNCNFLHTKNESVHITYKSIKKHLMS